MAADLSRGALPFLRASRKLGHPHVSHAKESFRRGTHSLYSGHVPTTTLEKGFVAVFSAFKALGNPHRADMVAALGDTTSGPALRRMRDRMYEDAEGRAILSDRPIITNAGISEALAEHGIASHDDEFPIQRGWQGQGLWQGLCQGQEEWWLHKKKDG